MDKLKDIDFQHILISSVNIQDRKLPYWLNINFTLQRTGQRLKEVKKFTVQKEIRNSIVPFAKELDNRFSSASSIQQSDPDNPIFEKENISPGPHKRKISDLNANISHNYNENEAQTFKCLSERSYTGSNENTQVISSEASQTNLSPDPRLVMRTLHLEIMASLQKAIQSGNFYEIWSGPFVEMESDGHSKYISDTSPYQQAQLIHQATALYYYYE